MRPARKIPSPVALILLLAAACGTPPDSGTPPPAPEATATSAPVETLTPSLTPIPTVRTPLVVLLAPEGADPELEGALGAMISETAADRGLRWQLRQAMTVEEVRAEADFVIALPPYGDLEGLIAAAPGTGFLVVGATAIAPAPNLILVSQPPGSQEAQAFMGGYIGALITEDWRIGIITTEDEGEGARFAAFENGMRYFCGLCRPQYAPFYNYPFFLSLPETASAAEWRALADFMRDRLVGTVYVSPGTGGRELVEALAELDVRVVGGSPPPEGLQEHWVASLRTDLLSAYAEYLPRLLDGETGITAMLPLEVRDVNPQLLSSGKLRLVDGVLADLLAGFILPGDADGP